MFRFMPGGEEDTVPESLRSLACKWRLSEEGIKSWDSVTLFGESR